MQQSYPQLILGSNFILLNQIPFFHRFQQPEDSTFINLKFIGKLRDALAFAFRQDKQNFQSPVK
jgi:hypothetical protein